MRQEVLRQLCQAKAEMNVSDLPRTIREAVAALFSACIVKFSLNFRHGRQAAFQVPGQGFDQFGLPLGDADGLFQIAQRIFNGQMVTFLAQQQADGRSVIGMAQLVVHG